MQNRIAATLTEEDMTAIKTASEAIFSRLPFLQTQSWNETKHNGGWPSSIAARVMAERAVEHGKQNKNVLSPFINLDELERDVDLARQLRAVSLMLSDLSLQVGQTINVLEKELAAQSLLIYNQLKVATAAGACSDVAIKDMARLLPGSKGRRKKAEQKEDQE